jgi:hypothetical protein
MLNIFCKKSALEFLNLNFTDQNFMTAIINDDQVIVLPELQRFYGRVPLYKR